MFRLLFDGLSFSARSPCQPSIRQESSFRPKFSKFQRAPRAPTVPISTKCGLPPEPPPQAFFGRKPPRVKRAKQCVVPLKRRPSPAFVRAVPQEVVFAQVPVFLFPNRQFLKVLSDFLGHCLLFKTANPCLFLQGLGFVNFFC